MGERYALVSVYDKEGVAAFATALEKAGYRILSSGGTAKALKAAGIAVVDVSQFTGSPEMMDGRVKTLHPRIHGGILMDRSNKKHLEEAKKNGIEPIDIVAVNLYPFEQTIMGNQKLSEAIENIDIGGPTLVRAAAKNYQHVTIVCDPADYAKVMEDLKKGPVSEKLRRHLAITAWEHVAHYDAVIEHYFREQWGSVLDYPEYLNLTFRKKQNLRYGENPHQTAAVYHDPHEKNISIVDAKQYQGKLLSYNNILDLNSAYRLLTQFDEPTVIIVKHNNPCGVASDKDILKAYKIARAVDPEAAFGGVVTINRKVTKQLAEEIINRFIEIVLAPAYDQEAMEVFKKKPNLRVMELPISGITQMYRTYRSVVGGLLVQDADVELYKELKVVTKRKPTEAEMKSMLYAWKIAKYVRSNAVIYARENRAVGIGAGQMKRVDAAKIRAMIAAEFGENLKGCAMASDAFFPFRDGIDYAASVGVTAIIQPGGSVRDAEVIAAADEHNIAMVFTGTRHFRH
ncbi:Bifunctional purine biosynthesis protein PurH [uncultured archaeon]|nr:Bifunctional purine biosynthesis protein PurH [uncultured archaeon]